MLRVIGSKHRFMWGWFGASSLVLFLIISGCVISPRRLPGDVVPGTTPTPTPTGTPTPTPTPGTTPTPAQGKLYVTNQAANAILRFDSALTDSGNVPPAATISGANTLLNQPAYMFLDTAADRLFVANTGNLSILIFDNISTKTGNVAPERQLSGANTTFILPTDVSLDKGRDLLYVADDTEIQVFASASTATGNIAPTRSYSTSTSTISAIFIDGANDRLYVADPAGTIDVYDNISTVAAGAISANRSITGANTHLGTPAGLAIDGGGRLVVTNATAKSITIFNNAAGANGNISPSAEIFGTNTGFNTPEQVVVDTTGSGTAYNIDPAAARVAIYGSLSSTTGNVAPTRLINGPATTFSNPVGIAFDRTR